jgi:ubiquinone/menaquinone biosynthesis C-methylase UbiE
MANHVAVGDLFPGARIEGVDLSPIQPEYVPENVHFFVDDFEEEWAFEDACFDFIHVRHTVHSIRNRQLLLHRAYR